jgi:F-type H+-transporting ATPase subunit gamma
MAVGKEIRTKITSVQNTQKITKAMEMVAASKMRRAQESMAAGKPYATHIRAVIGHVANAASEFHHVYMKERAEIKRVGYIIVSTDRGLCGGLNINLFKASMRSMKEWSDKGAQVELCVIGKKAQSFFGSFGSNITASVTELGDSPSVSDLIGGVKIMLDAFNDGKIDLLFIASNTFVNTMTQEPRVQQLLPLQPDKNEKLKHRWDYIYEPNESNLLESLLRRYIESQTHQSVVENISCEQAARMVAMKSATDNAGELISELKLIYNKARQAAITQEISEIVSGAAAT